MLSDLQEAKAILEIDADDPTEDVRLLIFLEWASQLIEAEILDRPLALKSRTEYYAGTGTQQLLLRSRPVFTTPTIEVSVDDSGLFGQVSGSFGSDTALTWGDDFGLKIDTDDGSSKCGILVRNNALWERPSVRYRGLLSPSIGPAFGNIKVTYTAGYTVATMPAPVRAACLAIVATYRFIFPIGMPIGGDGYESATVNVLNEKKGYLTALAKPHLMAFKNWSW
jgi:hypothetical protein